MSVQGLGNPTIAVPGLTPTSPVMTDAPAQVTVVPARTAKGDRFAPKYAWARAGVGVAKEMRAESPTLASRRTRLRFIVTLPLRAVTALFARADTPSLYAGRPPAGCSI